MYDKNSFPEITSTSSRNRTLFVTCVFVLFILLGLALVGQMAVTAINSITMPLIAKVFLIVMASLALIFFGWLTFMMIKGSGSKITHITVDKNGIHYYNSHGLVQTLGYDELTPSTGNEKYDVFEEHPYNNEEFSLELFCYVVNPIPNTPEKRQVSFVTQYIITNDDQLKRHFLNGIITMRPDLKISPYTLNLYGLKAGQLNL